MLGDLPWENSQATCPVVGVSAGIRARSRRWDGIWAGLAKFCLSIPAGQRLKSRFFQ